MPLVGSESTDAGRGQPAVLGDDAGRRVLGDHQAGVDARRRATGTAAGRGSGSRRAAGRPGARRSRRPRRRRWPGSRRRSRAARRGSCRSTRPGRPAAPPGCRRPSAARGRRPAVTNVERVPGGAGDLRRAAHRVRVLHRVHQVVAVRVHDRASPAAAGGCSPPTSPGPGAAGSRAAPAWNGRSEPSIASIASAAVTSAIANRCAASSIASSSMPSMPSVPLISARPSLAASSIGRSPARCSASPPSIAGAVLAEHPALAEQHQRAVRQRRQVAGGAERAVLGHPRRDVVR